MRELYDEVARHLDTIDFETIWAGFTPFEFALFDEHSVYFADKKIPWDKRFLGNTAIHFDGKPLAIWGIRPVPKPALARFASVFSLGKKAGSRHTHRYDGVLPTQSQRKISRKGGGMRFWNRSIAGLTRNLRAWEFTLSLTGAIPQNGQLCKL